MKAITLLWLVNKYKYKWTLILLYTGKQLPCCISQFRPVNNGGHEHMNPTPGGGRLKQVPPLHRLHAASN